MTDALSPEVMKLARETAQQMLGYHGRAQDADIIARALTADRASCQARVEELERALRDAFCPRPCNHRPDHFEVGLCVDAGECGCSLGSPLQTPEQRVVVAESRSALEGK